MCIQLMDDRSVPRGYICRCTSPQDSGTFCEDRNYCFSNPCQNGGTCTNSLNGYQCKCPSKWTGVNCNRFADYETLKPSCYDGSIMCKNGGSCLKNLNDYFYSCKCMPFYSGQSCEIYDMCSATKPCLNNGNCVNRAPNSFECQCLGQYYGDLCQHINLCYNITCQNGGVCDVDLNTNQPYCRCTSQFMGQYCAQCRNGYTGPNCDQPVNACTPNPCINGICLLDSGFGYRCDCSEGKLRLTF